MLQAILCEIRELRSAIQQSQATAPLIEANRRDREQVASRLAELERERFGMRTRLQEVATRHARIQTALRNREWLRIESEQEGEERKAELEEAARNFAGERDQLQRRDSELSVEIGRVESRLAEIDGQFKRLVEQMRGIAAASDDVCGSG